MARVKKQIIREEPIYEIPPTIDDDIKFIRQRQAQTIRSFLLMGKHETEIARLMEKRDPEHRSWTRYDVQDYIKEYL